MQIPQPSSSEPQFKCFVDGLRCQLCDQIESSIVHTSCGHRYCEECFDRTVPKDGSAIKCLVDEDCYQMICKDHKVIGTRVDVDSLPVLCLYYRYGCVTNMSWGAYPEHIKTCPHRRLNCPNRKNGCPQMLKEKHLPSHLEKCHYQISACHQSQYHRFGCPLAVVFCNFQQVGCRFMGNAFDLENHLKNQLQHHLELLVHFLLKLQTQFQVNLSEQSSKLSEQKSEIHMLKSKIRELQAYMDDRSVPEKAHMLVVESSFLQDKIQKVVEEHQQKCSQTSTNLTPEDLTWTQHNEIDLHQMQRLLGRISKKIATDQEMTDLGLQLGLQIQTIKSIRTDNPTSINQAVLVMLHQWSKLFQGSTQYALDQLKLALQNVGLSNVCDEF